jgi:hypothetical protein
MLFTSLFMINHVVPYAKRPQLADELHLPLQYLGMDGQGAVNDSAAQNELAAFADLEPKQNPPDRFGGFRVSSSSVRTYARRC